MNYLKIKFENDKIFEKNDFPLMVSRTVADMPVSEKINRDSHFSLNENTVKMTTIECILENSENGKIIALNFANAIYAGGGYTTGGNAQEESLCRASMLYYTICNQKEYYNANKIHALPDYTDYMIYSENVPVIRDDNGKMLENPVNCNFITSPAVNRNFARFMISDKKIAEIMTVRISKILSLAVSENPDVLILGAFGCGAFGNKRQIILPIFEDAVNLYVPDKIKVIFAIP